MLQDLQVPFSIAKDGYLNTQEPDSIHRLMSFLPNRHNCVLVGRALKGDFEVIRMLEYRLMRSRLKLEDLIWLEPS